MENSPPSNNSKEKSEKESEKSTPSKVNLLKKKLKVMRTALKDENSARLEI